MDVTPPESVEPGSPERRDPCTWRKIKTEDEGVPKDSAPGPSCNPVLVSVKTEDSQNTAVGAISQIENPQHTSTSHPSINSEPNVERSVPHQQDPVASSSSVSLVSRGSSPDTESDLSDISDGGQSSFEPDSDLDSGESPGDDENDTDWDEAASKPNPKTKKTTPSKRKPRRVVKTAREFVARLHEQEDAKEEKKRKREEENPSSRKVQKTSSSSSNKKPDAPRQTISGQPGDGNANAGNASASAIPSIQATTHRSQFSQILKSIPLDRDTRHTKTQKRDLRQAVQIFGYKKVLAVDGNWLLKGMQTPLKDYQQTATAWMVKREWARTAPHGGLLGDTMGLGKTVVSLNTIVGNPASVEDAEEFSKTTLVVVPNQDIAFQWRNEIRKHCAKSRGGSFVVYSKSLDWDADECMNQWIV